MARGRFIVFEGLDGAGTSTQVFRLRDFLLLRGINVEVSKEPSNGPIGSAIRLAVEGRVSLDPTALALAFAADRADHLFNTYNGIVTALDQGRWIISDRYVLSSLAYQGIDIDDMNWLTQINRFVIIPDLTIFVDAPVDVCARRIGMRSSHFELFHSTEKLEKVAANFSKVTGIKELVGTLCVVDGTKDPDTVFKSLLPAMDGLLSSDPTELVRC